MNEHQKGYLAVLLAAVLWSCGGLLIKLVGLPPVAITAWRSTYAMLVFAVLFRSNILVTNGRMWITSVCYAATLLLFVTATKMTTAANAIFLQSTAPVYILLLEPVLFKLKIKRADILVVLATLFGMSLFFLDHFDVGGMNGNLLGLLSGVSLAAFILGQRLNREETHYAAIFWGNLLVAAVGFAVCGLTDQPVWNGWPDFWRLTFLGVVQIGLAYAFFTYGLKRILAIEASLLAFVEPLLNPVWVWLGYGEIPGKWSMIGGGLIVSSLVIWTIAGRSKTPDA